MAEGEEGTGDRIDALIERFEEDVRRRPLPPAEPGPTPGDSPPTAAPVVGTPMAASVVEEIRAELSDRTAAKAAPAVEMAAPAVPPPAEPEDLAAWWSHGERVEVAGHHVFARVLGDGPWLTAIHGFPTSSWDWEPVSRELRHDHRLLAFDLLGFGDSDKPRGHDWSAFEQADIIEGLWRRLGVTETRVLAHDVGLTVALELLARQEEGRLAARITGFTLLNGGVYAGFHRPRRIQVLLQRPVIGALMARMLSEARFGPALAEVFGPEHQPSAAELHQHWRAVARRDGGRNYHRLIKYIPERRANAPRWESALEKTALPIRFVWGMADPVSGAHMAEVIRERRSGADIVELAGIGHYPQLEAPGAVVEAMRRT
jgi:pimeloyl-ACP methyl ester carboxylesterase